ncbi:MAG: magnesium chelatase subunit D [Proteobacteria bacterium]|nr:magnesium chelatase subunit D [Pseudomonadota bacterium]
MSPEDTAGRLRDAIAAAAILAVDPSGLGGICLRGPAGVLRDLWLESLRCALPPGGRVRRVPAHASEGRLLGELDLEATLAAGRPVIASGLLAAADGALLVLAGAERLDRRTAAHYGRVLDERRVPPVRGEAGPTDEVHLGLVALDESEGDDDPPAAGLRDRLALHLDLEGLRATRLDPGPSADAVIAARTRLDRTSVPDALLEELTRAALLLGIDSARAPLQAVRVTRIAAALNGRAEAIAEDAALAARLVLAPRATRVPAEDAAPPPAEPPPDRTDVPPEEAEPGADSLDANADLVLEAARAAIPRALLDALTAGGAPRAARAAAGRSGAEVRGALRGRPAGVRAGAPDGRRRLSLLDTLRAAAPWQRLRRAIPGRAAAPRILVRRDDLRVRTYQSRTETTTIFVVDASGSAAMHRLAEAKGAVELVLADCYVRRDRVALVAFRRTTAELLLAPTRSLVRAKKSLAQLAGGGGTPLAAGLDAAARLAAQILRRGGTPTVVVLSDGRANVALDGSPGRGRAEDDARAAAQRLRLAGAAVLFVDTSPRPAAAARELADTMRARYLPLPHADARVLSRAATSLNGR